MEVNKMVKSLVRSKIVEIMFDQRFKLHLAFKINLI